MKRKLLFTFLLLFLFIDVCYAFGECNSIDDRIRLREEANNVKVSYEPIMMYCKMDDKGDIDSSNDEEICGIIPNENEDNYDYEKYLLNITVYNMSDSLFIKMKGDKNSDIYLYNSDKDDDGVIRIMVQDITTVRNVTFTVYAKGVCDGYELKTLKLTVPKYNYYSQFDVCDGISDYYLCQEFITHDIESGNFFDQVNSYREKIEAMEENSIDLKGDNESGTFSLFKKISDYKYIVVIVILVIGIALTFVLLKKKVKR